MQVALRRVGSLSNNRQRKKPGIAVGRKAARKQENAKCIAEFICVQEMISMQAKSRIGLAEDIEISEISVHRIANNLNSDVRVSPCFGLSH
jgi:hypothetical protein